MVEVPSTTPGADVDARFRDADTDGDGSADGVEDANRNGRVAPGETDPGVPDLAPTLVPMPAPWLALAGLLLAAAGLANRRRGRG